MALKSDKNLKLYYSIKEVAEMFALKESTLRYWEKKFPFLKPKTTGSAMIRQYQEKDIEQIRLIYNLVKVGDLKMTVAQKILTKNRRKTTTKAEIWGLLMDVKTDLLALKKQLDCL